MTPPFELFVTLQKAAGQLACARDIAGENNLPYASLRLGDMVSEVEQMMKEIKAKRENQNG